MRSKKTSSGETLNKYMKGAAFWDNKGAFSRNNPLYSEKWKAWYEEGVRKMKANERQLTRLEPSIGNGVRV